MPHIRPSDNVDGFAADGTPFCNPSRPPRQMDLRKALRNFRILLRDSEKTSAAFGIFEALPSRSLLPQARAFTLSRRGEELRASEPYLPDILEDRKWLHSLRRGSVGRAYLEFMEREGLSASALVDQSQQATRSRYHDLIEWFKWRQRDTHDLLHVLSGYGRDALGEQCVLLFTHGQAPSQANLLLGYAGAMIIHKRHRSTAPVLRAVREAHLLGKACPPIAEQSIRELLAGDLAKVRQRFGIAEPAWYRLCHALWRNQRLDPGEMLR